MQQLIVVLVEVYWLVSSEVVSLQDPFSATAALPIMAKLFGKPASKSVFPVFWSYA